MTRFSNQAHQEHLAGTVANLDELRARVQYQTQQQVVIAAENEFEKAKIALNREIGLAPEQQIQLTDSAPYAELQPMSIEAARIEAYASRQDFQMLKQELRVAELERRATAHQRFPTLTFGGNYGVTGISGGVYHGTFAAVGTLHIPIFQEAKFRGDNDVAQAQLRADPLANGGPDAENRSAAAGQSAGPADGGSRQFRWRRATWIWRTPLWTRPSSALPPGVTDSLPVAEAQSTLAPGADAVCEQRAAAERGAAGAGPQPGHRRYAVQNVFGGTAACREVQCGRRSNQRLLARRVLGFCGLSGRLPQFHPIALPGP